ncbi:hypothetical protein [Roseateles sp.]|uniref:hypothetical protein n=1 Tax=Roseateles sp. TaxID=1971397 RepID=UPI003265BF93
MMHSPCHRSHTVRLLCAAALAWAAVGVAAKDKPEPLVATAQITETIVVPSPDGACQSTAEHPGLTATGKIAGQGVGIPIGSFAITSIDCIRSDIPGQFFPPFAFSSSTLTLTARNGDQLVAKYSGTGTLSPLGLLILTGSFRITGGTGAFRGAGGSGSLSGVENIITQPASGFVTLSGQITR